MTFAKILQPRMVVAAALAVTFITTAVTETKAEALLLIEAQSGKVLYAENATQPWYPASITKLMTAYLTLRAVKEGRISFDTLLTVSENAASQQPSKMGFKAGTQVTVDNALKMLLVKSANDMAVVLAEGLAGSVEKFAEEMNEAAHRLGMTQTNYVNPNGLPAEGHVTSARDLGILARTLIKDMPEYDLYWHISAIKFGRRIIRNFNTLIDRYPGADGMKTGFICASGFNLVGSATRNGKRLIAIVLGAPSSPVRAVKAAQLLERGFQANPLSWLQPSLGTVDALAPIDASPPDLRDQMCGKHRKRPAAESEDSDEEIQAEGENGSASARLSSLPAFTGKPSTLIGPLTPSMAPIVVFAGPSKKSPETNVAATAAKSASDAKKAANSVLTPPLPRAITGPAPAATTPSITTPAFAATNAPWPAIPAPAAPVAAAPSSNRAVPVPRPKPRTPKPAAAQ